MIFAQIVTCTHVAALTVTCMYQLIASHSGASQSPAHALHIPRPIGRVLLHVTAGSFYCMSLLGRSYSFHLNVTKYRWPSATTNSLIPNERV